MMKKNDIQGGVLLLLVLGAFGAFFLLAPQGSKPGFGPVEVPGSTLYALAGTDHEVAIAARVVKPGFVTIHESLGGAPGPIVGVSAYLDANDAATDVIALSTAMIPGQSYVALLHVDNGDGVFAVSDDMPVTSDGESVRYDVTYTPDDTKNE